MVSQTPHNPVGERGKTLKILYLVPYTPNKIRVRPYNLIRSLAARGNAVTLLTLWSNAEDLENIQALKTEGVQVHAFPLKIWRSLANSAFAALTPDPLQAYYCWQPQLANKLVELAAGSSADFDVVHIEHLRGARFGEYLQTRQKSSGAIPIVWDSVDNITYLFQQAAEKSKKLKSRLMTRFELPRTRQYEARMARLFDRTLVTSRLDLEAYYQVLPDPNDREKIEILPNGVDLEYFTPLPGTQRDPATLVISGKMSYHANISMTNHLVEHIMPYIWEKRPDVKLWIVGKDPPQEIRQLSERPEVTVTGFVADLRPYLQSATVALAPLTYGAGIQNKVLEAMACSTPVVATPKAVAALSARAGKDMLVEQDPAAFAAQVLALMDDPARAREIGEAGRKFVEDCHSWTSAAARLEEIYQNSGKNHSE
jgi:sugar transferase (PEP-CTERM/EpsH1 system associated)